MPRRSFLILQGPLSLLYRRLADRLAEDGHAVHRIHLCAGDALLWGRGGTWYRGRIADWPGFVERTIAERGITDVLLHGERRLYHRIAASVARRMGVRVIVTELGYLRPGWLTVEADGTGAASRFPACPETIRRLAGAAPAPRASGPLETAEAGRFAIMAAYDMAYNLANTMLWVLAPHYRRHTLYYPPLEYAAWAVRLLTARRRERQAASCLGSMRAGQFHVFALQLEGDFQVRHRSPRGSMLAAIEEVLRSFAAHAPADLSLLMKAHPLDNGLEAWRRRWPKLVRAYALEERVQLIDGGGLRRCIEGAAGLVTLNSTAGIEALGAGVPVKTLAPALYDVPGLTHQGDLASFWRAPRRPDPDLVAAFRAALAVTVQVPGSLYGRDGLAAAVEGLAQHIATGGVERFGSGCPGPRQSALREALRAAARVRAAARAGRHGGRQPCARDAPGFSSASRAPR
jgi:capsular polysaccharide export protein